MKKILILLLFIVGSVTYSQAKRERYVSITPSIAKSGYDAGHAINIAVGTEMSIEQGYFELGLNYFRTTNVFGRNHLSVAVSISFEGFLFETDRVFDICSVGVGAKMYLTPPGTDDQKHFAEAIMPIKYALAYRNRADSFSVGLEIAMYTNAKSVWELHFFHTGIFFKYKF